MRTSKPISTISYNSEAYLKGKLEELRDSGAITWYAYVRHTAEEDEKKDHFHVIVSPNRILDTGVLGAMFKELDPSHPDKPLGCIEWKCSKREDWLLYSIHDPVYLASKLEKREFVYELSDVVTSDRDELEELHRTALREGKWAREHKLINGLMDGSYTAVDLVASGAVSLGQMGALRSLVSVLSDPSTLARNGLPTHTPKASRKAKKAAEEELGTAISAAASAVPDRVVENGQVLTKKQIDKQLDRDQRAIADTLRKDSAIDGTRVRVGRQMTLEDYDLSKGFIPLPDDAVTPFD